MLYALRLDEELVNVTITNALPSKSLVRDRQTTDRQAGRQAGTIIQQVCVTHSQRSL